MQVLLHPRERGGVVRAGTERRRLSRVEQPAQQACRDPLASASACSNIRTRRARIQTASGTSAGPPGGGASEGRSVRQA